MLFALIWSVLWIHLLKYHTIPCKYIKLFRADKKISNVKEIGTLKWLDHYTYQIIILYSINI